MRMARRPNGAGFDPVYSVRIPRDAHALLKERAEGAGVSVSFVLRTFGEAYGEGFINLPEVKNVYPVKVIDDKEGKPRYPGYSVRIPFTAHAKLKERAEREEVSVSYVLRTFAEAFGEETVNLPEVTIHYPASPSVI